MWTQTKVEFIDIEGQRLTLERNELDGLILEAQKGVYFNTYEEFISFLETLKKYAEAMYADE